MRLKGFTSISWWTIDFCFQNQPVNCMCVCLFSLYLRIDSCASFSLMRRFFCQLQRKQAKPWCVKGRGVMKKRRRTRDTSLWWTQRWIFNICTSNPFVNMDLGIERTAIRFCWTAKRNRLPRPDKWIPAAGFIADIYQSENLIKVEGGKGEGSGMF